MTQYLLTLRANITNDYSKITPEQFGGILAAYQAWGEKLGSEGRLLFGHKLKEECGRVMTPDANGENVSMKDGPYVETKEVVGGVYLIEADSYDHAAQLCEGHPNFTFGSIEIREIDLVGQPEE